MADGYTNRKRAGKNGRHHFFGIMPADGPREKPRDNGDDMPWHR
jgi:hypothetical protein